MNSKISNFLSSSKSVPTFLVILLLGAAFFIGSLSTKVSYLESAQKNNVLGANTPPSQPTQPAPTRPQSDLSKLPKPSDTDHVLGNINGAQVALIEYSDYECPFCKSFHPTVKQAVSEYGDKLVFVHRNFPLTSIHQKAQKFAEAAECIYKLGGNDKFWAFGEKLYADTSDAILLTDIPGIGSQLGVDQNQFKSCIDSGEMAKRVDSDYQGGLAVGVNGTPGNYILNLKTGKAKELFGAVPYAQLKSAIDSILQ